MAINYDNPTADDFKAMAKEAAANKVKEERRKRGRPVQMRVREPVYMRLKALAGNVLIPPAVILEMLVARMEAAGGAEAFARGGTNG